MHVPCRWATLACLGSPHGHSNQNASIQRIGLPSIVRTRIHDRAPADGASSPLRRQQQTALASWTHPSMRRDSRDRSVHRTRLSTSQERARGCCRRNLSSARRKSFLIMRPSWSTFRLRRTSRRCWGAGCCMLLFTTCRTLLAFWNWARATTISLMLPWRTCCGLMPFIPSRERSHTLRCIPLSR
ncbi:hypothetical protein VTK56DRAFT_9748 [Thermocarpiscus australiensis]